MESGINCDAITEHITYNRHFRIYDQYPTQQLVLLWANPSDYLRKWSNIPHVEVYINGSWYVVPQLDGLQYEEWQFILEPRMSANVTMMLSQFLPYLQQGRYRLVIFYTGDRDGVISAEFIRG